MTIEIEFYFDKRRGKKMALITEYPSNVGIRVSYETADDVGAALADYLDDCPEFLEMEE